MKKLGTVLLVEDEPVVLRLANDLLAENGYRVLAASLATLGGTELLVLTVPANRQ